MERIPFFKMTMTIGLSLLLLISSTSASASSSSAARGLYMGPVRRSPSSRCVSASSRQRMVAPQAQYYRGQLAAQLGGDVLTDTVFGGFHNFLSLYNLVLTGRILLSWFPNIARQPVFEPLFVVTNPFFNIFRGLIPPIGGVDLSPLPAFFLLSFLTNATDSLGAELPSSKGKKGASPPPPQASTFRRNFFLRLPQRPRFGRAAAAGWKE